MLLKINTKPAGFVADELDSLLKSADHPTSIFNINSISVDKKTCLLTFLGKLTYLDSRISKVIESLSHEEVSSAAISIKIPPYASNSLSMKTYYIKNDTDEAQITAMNHTTLPDKFKNVASSYSFSFSHIEQDNEQYKIEGHLFNHFDHHKELIDTLDTEGFGFNE